MGAISPARAKDLIETEFGPALAPAQMGAHPKALCHPLRDAFADGLCDVCTRVRDKSLAPLTRTLNGGVEPTDETREAALTERQASIELHQTVEYVKGLARAAEIVLQHNLVRYAELHLQAAEVAAKDGDSKPMEWALTHIGMAGKKPLVEPQRAAGGGKEGGGSGVVVQVGIQLGAIPPGAAKVEIVEATPVEGELG